MRRVVMGGAFSSALALVIVFGSAAAPAAACGCGVLVGPADAESSTSGEQVILSWDGENESMEFAFDASTAEASSALIIPTPVAPTVSAGDPRRFALVNDQVLPDERFETDLWGLGYLRPKAEVAPVTVVDRVHLGELEATTIAATDSAALTTWLAANEFEITPEQTDALAAYVELGWSFTAVRLDSTAALDGQIDPIRLTFTADRLIYPMRPAKSDAGALDVRVFVFDAQRSDLTQAGAPTLDLDAMVTTVWAGKTTDPRLQALGAYLTAFDVHYDDAEEQATSDIGVITNLDQSDVQPVLVHYRMVTLLGMPVATLGVLWLVLGIGIAVAHLRGRRRAR